MPAGGAVVQMRLANMTRADWDAFKTSLKQALSSLTGATAAVDQTTGRLTITVPSSQTGQNYTITFDQVSFAESSFAL